MNPNLAIILSLVVLVAAIFLLIAGYTVLVAWIKLPLTIRDGLQACNRELAQINEKLSGAQVTLG